MAHSALRECDVRLDSERYVSFYCERRAYLRSKPAAEVVDPVFLDQENGVGI